MGRHLINLNLVVVILFSNFFLSFDHFHAVLACRGESSSYSTGWGVMIKMYFFFSKAKLCLFVCLLLSSYFCYTCAHCAEYNRVNSRKKIIKFHGRERKEKRGKVRSHDDDYTTPQLFFF
jgi:hypothetical protein